MTNILRYKKTLIVIGALVVVAIVLLVIVQFRSNQPVNLKTTNLRTASSDVRAKAAAQMMTPIKNMPSAVDGATKKFLENQLAFILRQKYGPDATSLTATVRQTLGYDAAGGYSMYVDVPGENETYVAYLNMTNHNGTVVCAPQAQQMDPTNSHCFDIPAIDDNVFPNG